MFACGNECGLSVNWYFSVRKSRLQTHALFAAGIFLLAHSQQRIPMGYSLLPIHTTELVTAVSAQQYRILFSAIISMIFMFLSVLNAKLVRKFVVHWCSAIRCCMKHVVGCENSVNKTTLRGNCVQGRMDYLSLTTEMFSYLAHDSTN